MIFILFGRTSAIQRRPRSAQRCRNKPPKTNKQKQNQRSRRLVDMYGADDAVSQGADRPYCIRQIRYTVATMAEAAVKTGQLSLFLACACLMRTAISAQAPTQRVARCHSTR